MRARAGVESREDHRWRGAGLSRALAFPPAMTSEREASNEGIKLSAEVKPFVPKYTAVTVAWSEPSEACVFPRYYTTCYPYVQEPPLDKQQECIQDAPWDTTTSLPQHVSQTLMGCGSLGDYFSSCSLDATSNICTVPICSSSRQDRNYVKQTSLIRKEAGNIPRRRSKHEEPKVDSKRPEGNDSSCTTTRSLFHTALHSKSPMKSDRHGRAANSKYKHIPNTDSLPEPDFEMTIADFPKLQSQGNNDLLDLQKCTCWPLDSAEEDMLTLKSTVRPKTSALITKEGEVSVRWQPPERSLSSSSDTGNPRVSSSAKTQMFWATVLSQTPRRIATSPSSVLASSHSGSEGKVGVPEYKQSENKENASDSEAEGLSEKKKKKKKKKKAKSNSDVEKLPNESPVVQDPPRIEDDEEFPDLVAATDKNYKLGTPKFCSMPATKEQTEVILTRESEYESDSYPHNLLVTPKPDVLPGRKTGGQPSSSVIEKRKTQGSSKSSRKKSQLPVQLDLGGMLAALEQKQQAEKSKQSPKPVVLSVGSTVTLPSKESTPVIKSHLLHQEKVPHNPLDSSSPLVKKGKQREVPKAKKPTSLKKIILKEREQRKQQHLSEQTEIAKNKKADQQCTESTPEDQFISQITKAETVEELPVDPVIVNQSNLEIPTEINSSSENSLVSTQLNSTLPKIHSRRFRDYCTQVLSKEVDSCVTDLLKELVRFQDRQYQKDPVKAKTKRRLVMGLREVLKHLKLKKLKCVIISPNCEKIQSKGGLDETLHLIIDSACEQNIPFVFALNRKALGRCLNKAVPVSVVGIFSYDGAQDCFHKMVELTMEARSAYKEMIAALRESVDEENESDCTSSKISYKESNLQDAGKAPSPESDEEVPNYIKIWKRKLEEEYNPYVLELGKSSDC